MRCLLLHGAWLSHSAYDARMVKIVVAIAFESIEDDMSDPSVKHTFNTEFFFFFPQFLTIFRTPR